MISILTTNVFPNQDHLIMAAKCLETQTCQDFEWVLLDGHYNKNKDFISSLCEEYKIKRYIHAPLCKANHVGRMFHWEVYNNALILASHDLFLRFGIYRWLHSSVVEKAISYAQKGIFIDLPHKTVNFDDFSSLDRKAIIEKADLTPDYGRVNNYMACSAGMFSYSRNRMLEINGNNEAATLIVHHEDSDLNARWKHVRGVMSIKMMNAMLRFDHVKSPSNILTILEEGNSYCCGKPGCFSTYPNTFHLNYEPPVENEKFMYREFPWIKCSCCGTVSPVDADEYLDYLQLYPDPFGPVGVDGRVGRNIIPLYEDCMGANLEDKLNILTESHTDPRYVESKAREDNVNFQDTHLIFKNRIKKFCNQNNIKFIDKELLSIQHIIDRKSNDEVEFNIRTYLQPHIMNCQGGDIFLFELLQDVEYVYELNNIFEICDANRIFISMKHDQYPHVTKTHKSISWWDDYVTDNKDIYSDADETQKIRGYIDIKLQNYLHCFFCIKRYEPVINSDWRKHGVVNL
jgi:hypothetical protein